MNKKYLLRAVALLALSIFFIISFSPRSIPLLITVLPTLGLSLSLYFFIKTFRRSDKSAAKTGNWLGKTLPLTGALTFGLCLILSSLGQLSVASLLLVLGLALLSGFFIDRIKTTQ